MLFFVEAQTESGNLYYKNGSEELKGSKNTATIVIASAPKYKNSLSEENNHFDKKYLLWKTVVFKI